MMLSCVASLRYRGVLVPAAVTGLPAKEIVAAQTRRASHAGDWHSRIRLLCQLDEMLSAAADPSPLFRRGERGGACGDSDPAALVGDYSIGDAQSPAPVGDGAGGDQLLTLGAGRAQEVHLKIQGGKSGASGCDRLDRRPGGAFGQQGDDTSEDGPQLLQQARMHRQREYYPPV